MKTETLTKVQLAPKRNIFLEMIHLNFKIIRMNMESKDNDDDDDENDDDDDDDDEGG